MQTVSLSSTGPGAIATQEELDAFKVRCIKPGALHRGCVSGDHHGVGWPDAPAQEGYLAEDKHVRGRCSVAYRHAYVSIAGKHFTFSEHPGENRVKGMKMLAHSRSSERLSEDSWCGRAIGSMGRNPCKGA